MLTALDHFDLYFQTLRARAKARNILTRAQTEATAYEMAAGQYQLRAGESIPTPSDPDGWAAWKRITAQVVCLGSQILRTRLHGTVREVTWTAEDGAGRQAVAQADARLSALDLPSLASRGYEQLFCTGLVAFWAHVAEDGGARLSRLSGYLEPLPASRTDVDTPGGLLQTWQDGATSTWTVRIYDLETGEMREWRGARDPMGAMGRPADATQTLTYPPRLGVTYLDADNLPRGEMVSGAALIRAEMASTFKVKRVEELFSFPVPVLQGAVDFPERWGPGQPVKVPVNGGFSFVAPPGLDQLQKSQDRDQAKLSAFFSMPAGVIGSAWPSGDALEQVNGRFNTASRYYGRVLGGALARAVADYAQLAALDAPEPTILQDLVGEASARYATVRGLFTDGIIPLAAAARAVQDAVPGWTDPEVESWIQEQAGVTSPAAVARTVAAFDQIQDPARAGAGAGAGQE